ncbi:DUF4260 family protein [Polaribacter aestuariivivens]|uniref:DUF4260 family protein n=1 Tax=Polaribacter aestuariivivens TaxID=2304626 RepID=A0A5S3NCM2_9FLAO|nr:DUF4260 domain-containing protein [Polaribacter aestuariivivens]TMM32294.1 DUF4260 family protein [Polaribacter aestuariivivens]
MKALIKVEELMLFILSIVLFNQLNFDWWWYLALFFFPDISFFGYLINPKIGAYCYNFLHHKAIAIIVYFFGIYFKQESIQLIGIILFGHSSFDRILGYGLKYTDSFKNTHLGKIG